MNNESFHSLFLQMTGGDDEHFFRSHWRQRVLFSQSAVPQLTSGYSYAQFIADYNRLSPHRETLVVTIGDQGTRKMIRPDKDWGIDSALDKGSSLVVQALLFPQDSSYLPQAWSKFIALHYDLCSYLLPGLPQGINPEGAVATVDIFCTSVDTSTGGHYDTGDVFYFVLDGEKEWTLELVPDPETVLRLFSTEGKYMLDHAPQKEHVTITVRPGDCLYVPPFTYHRVSSQGRSLAVSIGLPAYTEATLLKANLVRLQRQLLMWKPLPSFPRKFQDLHEEAQRETENRVFALLNSMSTSVLDGGTGLQSNSRQLRTES